MEREGDVAVPMSKIVKTDYVSKPEEKKRNG